MEGHIQIKRLSSKINFQDSKEFYSVLWFSSGSNCINIEDTGFNSSPNLIVFIVPDKEISIPPQAAYCGWVPGTALCPE
jgi:hypothetical protein